MSRKVFARLYQPEIEALLRLADAERRPPAEQAGLLIAEGLRARGAIPERPAAAPTPPSQQAPQRELGDARIG
jgi:hypothetical protein